MSGVKIVGVKKTEGQKLFGAKKYWWLKILGVKKDLKEKRKKYSGRFFLLKVHHKCLRHAGIFVTCLPGRQYVSGCQDVIHCRPLRPTLCF